MKALKYCKTCKEYTLSDSCPKCKSPTVTPHPPKYSPTDKYAKYRRQSD